jgi:Uma2 family endonuclease
MTLAYPTTRRWTYEEYYRMADLGFFRDQRVELIDGEIFYMAPQKDLHAGSVSLTYKAFSRLLGETYWVRSQLPLRLGKNSEPEPDLSVTTGSEHTYLTKGGPKTALLIVEISETTLRFDRKTKASLYAKAGIADYWIVNLIDRQVEVYRDPEPDPKARFGFSYTLKKVHHEGDSIKPLAFKGSIAVADLFPRVQES